jgi:bifunctional UDP-N-acetylglucosamine pyrophosphorylase / glucosamine-1-phosphate N-acetyltransferase
MADINSIVKEFSSPLDTNKKETAIILAAGHGKRIKSQTSKMLHKIWEVPTVERVCGACKKGLTDANIIIVVGIKAEDVVKTIGKEESLSFAYQENQNGTGHAVQVALENIPNKDYDGTVYVFPGDMGLIDEETVKFFKQEFENSKADMMVLTGIYEGEIANNYYGRIVRVKDKDTKGSKSKNKGKVVEIIEYKDITKLDEKKFRVLKYNRKQYKYSRKELIENREFNSGVYAFKFKPLYEQIQKIESNNAQNEIYLTDLISLFNNNGYTVEAVSPKNQYVVMGFNNKSVLKEMDAIARKLVYEKLKDIITIDDPDDFFIEENVVDEILQMDKQGLPLDIRIGHGAYIGKGVKLNYNLSIAKNVFLDGDIKLGKNVVLKESVNISCFYGQQIEIGDNVEIHMGDIIKGNVKIGNECRIESGVCITGSDNCLSSISSGVVLKGLTYIVDSQIGPNILIEHCVLIRKKISKPENVKTEIYSVKYYMPETEGKDAVKPL